MLDIFADLLPHAGETELEERDRSNNKEDDDGDGGGKAVIDPAAAREGQVVHIANQDIGMPGRGWRASHGWSTAIEQIDQIEVIKKFHFDDKMDLQDIRALEKLEKRAFAKLKRMERVHICGSEIALVRLKYQKHTANLLY